MPPAQAVILPGFVRIHVSGRDRARFLHNFCTNNVKALQPGAVCEAFFTDVKARILAHGWVLAAAESLELWMFPGQESALLQHLGRYIITDDVVLRSATVESATVAVFGADPAPLLARCSGGPAALPELNHWREASADGASGNEAAIMQLCWAGTAVYLLAIESSRLDGLRQRLSSVGIPAADPQAFERLRIRERIPVCGTDLTTEHLAPEADRNVSAISYVKGCYLGQEPIARIDALGHVNRSLRAIHCDADPEVSLGGTVHLPGTGASGKLTSVCADSDDHGSLGLAVIRTHGLDLSSGLTVTTTTGEVVPAAVCG